MNNITSEMKVAHVLSRFPNTQSVFRLFGFKQFMNPLIRQTLGRLTTVEQACKKQAVDLMEFLSALNCAISYSTEQYSTPAPRRKISPQEIMVLNEVLRTNIASLVARHPRTRAVLLKYFGEGCFSCPAFGLENVEIACASHDADPVEFARDCLDTIQEESERGQ